MSGTYKLIIGKKEQEALLMAAEYLDASDIMKIWSPVIKFRDSFNKKDYYKRGKVETDIAGTKFLLIKKEASRKLIIAVENSKLGKSKSKLWESNLFRQTASERSKKIKELKDRIWITGLSVAYGIAYAYMIISW